LIVGREVLPPHQDIYRGPIKHDFRGTYYLVNGAWVRQGVSSEQDKTILNAILKLFKRDEKARKKNDSGNHPQ